jgi:UDPglucose 6-dehydrogenase
MRISVIGCGCLGAVHAASMAELRHEVLGIDVDRNEVELLGSARTPFFEPGFDEQPARAGACDRVRPPMSQDAGSPTPIEASARVSASGR